MLNKTLRHNEKRAKSDPVIYLNVQSTTTHINICIYTKYDTHMEYILYAICILHTHKYKLKCYMETIYEYIYRYICKLPSFQPFEFMVMHSFIKIN